MIVTDRKFLHAASDQVVSFDDSVMDLALELVRTMGEQGGLGLSAIQIGRPVRMFCLQHRTGDIDVFINPRIITSEKMTTSRWEGCLSVPGVRKDKKRYKRITVAYQDPDGSHHEKKLANLESFIFQHEMDHLDGVLIDD